MNFSLKQIQKSKTIEVLQKSPRSTISVIEYTDGHKYVIKQFSESHAADARTEYLYLQTVNADNVVKALDLIVSEEPVIVMQYLVGNTLSSSTFVKNRDYESCLAQLSATVSMIHAYGICLNDIKPDNIIMHNNKPYITDLGLATVNLYFEHNFRGTPAFAAPEKFLHQTNHFAADIFSLGMTFFYCKHGKTILDMVGQEEYQKLISNEELWQKNLDMLENDTLLLSMLDFSAARRPKAIDIAKALAEKTRTVINSLDTAIIDNFVFKTQFQAVDKLWKKKSLNCDYSDEPIILENLLSLWAETSGKKLLVLDESAFLSQPEEFFKSFQFGYREKNIYQPHFIDWLKEQQIKLLLRRNRQLNPTRFFDDILLQIDAMQLWIGEVSELKTVNKQDILDLVSLVPALKKQQNKIKENIKSAKPFHVRMLLLSMLKQETAKLDKNELADILNWSRISLPIVLVETTWENWYQLVQDGLLNRKIIFENNFIRSEARTQTHLKPNQNLISKIVEYAVKTGLYNIAGELSFLINKTEDALHFWLQYIDELIRKEFFLTAFEFVGQLKKRIKEFPFDLKKKEAFLARICGHFELSNQMYKILIEQSSGLMKAVLSVDQAIALQALNRFEDAISSYKKAIELFRLHKDIKSLLRAMNNLGVVYFGLQRYSDAEQLFNDVLTEARNNQNIQFEVISYLNLSDVQLKRGEWKRVIYFTDKAINVTYTNQKWNLYANGNIIKARALFALGEFEAAENILVNLKSNPQINENLLQYQEILAWLMHFYLVFKPESALQLVDQLEFDDSTLHEILRRELFFINLYRKRYLQASNYLHELSDVAILKAFFNSENEHIIENLKLVKNQSDSDSYLYYLTNYILMFPIQAYNSVQNDIQEATNLFTYKPITYLKEKKDRDFLQTGYWSKIIDEMSQIDDFQILVNFVLEHLYHLFPADKYIFLQVKNGTLIPIKAIDGSGKDFPTDKLLLSQNLLQLTTNSDGYFYYNPAMQYLDENARSSVLGLGINTALGYTIRINNQISGIFYMDSVENLEINDNRNAVLKTLFFITHRMFEKHLKTTSDEFFEGNEFQFDEDLYSHAIIGKSKKMRELFDKIALVAGHNVNVLITGPTGSGKELVAREIHRQYIEKNQSLLKTPFIAVNCAAIPEQLLESELFGYRKGAFTGAVMDKKGKLLLADNGTIFLDEIGEMPILLQSKLLRAIQEKVITPLGSDQDIPVNLRIIAASNQNLEEMVQQNTFRADLFYRLKVMTIELPSLDERKDDIPLLSMFFLKKFNDKFKKSINGFHPSTLDYLQGREWKGNIRELENEIERAVLLCSKDFLTIDDFTTDSDSISGFIYRNLPLDWQQFKEYKKRIEDELDQRYISSLLEEADNNIRTASKIGNLERMQVYRLLKKKSDQN